MYSLLDVINGHSFLKAARVSEMKSSSGYGMAGGESKPVEDPETYQKAFDAIRKAIFVRKNAFLVPDKLS